MHLLLPSDEGWGVWLLQLDLPVVDDHVIPEGDDIVLAGVAVAGPQHPFRRAPGGTTTASSSRSNTCSSPVMQRPREYGIVLSINSINSINVIVLVMVGAAIKPMFREAAKRRQATSTGGKKPQLRSNLSQAEHANANEQAAALVNVSAGTVKPAEQLSPWTTTPRPSRRCRSTGPGRPALDAPAPAPP